MGDEVETSSRITSVKDDEVVEQLPFLPFIAMEEFFDKLKLLNYEDEFVKNAKIRPLNRHYFALQTNAGEQFFLFSTLASWLINKCGKYMDPPQEYDDPNSTIAIILDISQNMGIQIDFSPNKLKQGYGRHAIYILSNLADKALQYCNFTPVRPIPPLEVDDEEPVVEDNSELILEQIEEEMAAEELDSEDDEDTLLNIEDLNKLNFGTQKVEDVLESTTNTEEWQLEVERVLPLLKVTVRSDSRDWRTHLEKMKHHGDVIRDTMKTAKSQIDKLVMDVGDTMDKITTRERFLNSAMETTLNRYKTVQAEFSKYNERYKELNSGVVERQKKISKITDELEVVTQEMESRGNSMTDETPLIKTKKAITVLKADILNMDVKIGVLEHDILQAKLKEKLRIQQNLHSEVYA